MQTKEKTTRRATKTKASAGSPGRDSVNHDRVLEPTEAIEAQSEQTLESHSSSSRKTKKVAKTNSSEAQGINLICSQTLLSQALTFVKAAVPTKPLHPVLANVLIVADSKTQQLMLTTSDLTLTLSASFEAQIETAGEMTVPVEVLASVVSKCPEGSLTLNTVVRQATATQAKRQQKSEDPTPSLNHFARLSDEQGGVTEIRGMDAGEFPSVATVNASQTALPIAVVKTGLKGVLFAASTDETKKILTGVQWTIDPTQASLRCTATDGHQVAIAQLSTGGIGRKRRSPKQLEPVTSCVIPVKALRELTRMLEKVDSDTLLQFAYDAETKRVLFELEAEGIHKQVICQCLEDVYPDCQTLLDQYQYPHQVTIDKSDLITRLERIAVLADKKENGVTLLFDERTQEIQLEIERHYGKGRQVIPADIPTVVSGTQVVFNIAYLLNAVRALSSSALQLVMDKAYTPCNIRSCGDLEVPELSLEATYFIMPLFDREQAAKTMRTDANSSS